MQAGRLRHRVVIEGFTQTQDQTTGELTNTWSTYAALWAEFTPLSTRDMLQAQAVNSGITARCLIRSSIKARQITSVMRVLFRGKYYKIDGDPVPDNESGLEWLTLNLAEGEKAWNEDN